MNERSFEAAKATKAAITLRQPLLKSQEQDESMADMKYIWL